MIKMQTYNPLEDAFIQGGGQTRCDRCAEKTTWHAIYEPYKDEIKYLICATCMKTVIELNKGKLVGPCPSRFENETLNS